MGEVAHRAGEAFNDRVADVLERYPRLVVKRRLKKLGTQRVPGDIDVLVASTKRRTLFLIECKDLALCRTPREFANQSIIYLMPVRDSSKSISIERIGSEVISMSCSLP